MGEADTLLASGFAVSVETKERAPVERYLIARKVADAKLRTLQVHEDADGAAVVHFRAPDDPVQLT